MSRPALDLGTPGPSRVDRFEAGVEARDRVPLRWHGDWVPASGRRDPVAILDEQNASRLQDLVPMRWRRTAASPFTFLRGSAAVMAMDLAAQPDTGLIVQLCGDAHLSNFGMFATPERNLVFDLNDFDETLPGPFEWDVKRLAASIAVAAHNNGLNNKTARMLAEECVRTYCSRILACAGMSFLDVWYSRVGDDDILNTLARLGASRARKRASKAFMKARHRTRLEAFPRLAAQSESGSFVIREDPPLIMHVYASHGTERVHEVLGAYIETLPDDRKVILEHYSLADVAMKVVGVGSVGTRSYVALLLGDDHRDPLLLQAKEANESVLSRHLGPSRYTNMGERVVQGQRLLQAASDLFLGWSRASDVGIDYYFRQLRDMKLSASVETMPADLLGAYGRLCGWTLARAHARSGDAAAIAGYVGGGKRFSSAIAEFAVRYAGQTLLDHAELVAAIAEGRIVATEAN